MRRLNKSGFGLMEAVIAVAVMGAAGAAFMSMTSQVNRSLAGSRNSADRDRVFSTLDQSVNAVTNLQASLPLNAGTMLQLCTAVGGTSDCIAKSGGAQITYPFDLINAAGVALAGGNTPIRYSVEGLVCPGPASPQCPYEATAYFQPICSGAAATCDQAASVAFGVTFKQNPNVELSTKQHLKERSTAPLHIFAMPTLLAVSNTCPAGKVMSGTDANGFPVCTQIAAGSCPAGQMMTGINSSGALICSTAQFPAVQCPTNYFLNGITAGGAPICATFAFGSCPADALQTGNFPSGDPMCGRSVRPLYRAEKVVDFGLPAAGQILFMPTRDPAGGGWGPTGILGYVIQ